MAHQLFIFHSDKEIPIDIVKKASDLVSLFRDEGEWFITKHQISYCYHAACFLYEDEIEELFKYGFITQNMVDVFRWLCDNTTLEIDCWNPCDREYGPWDMDDFKERILEIAKEYPQQQNIQGE